MTINAVNRSVNIRSSSDGKLYSKHPSGNAIGVDPWDWEGLDLGTAGLSASTAAGTVAWDAGGFARLTWNSAGIVNLAYLIPQDTDEITVQFDLRRHNTKSSKQLKITSKGLPTYTNNITAIGPTAGGYTGENMTVYYSDDSDGGDNDIAYGMHGTLVGGTSLTRSAPTFATKQVAHVAQDISGSTWATYKLYVKFNTDNTQNGEIAIWRDGTLLLHMTSVWNCATTTTDGVHSGVAAEVLNQYRYRKNVWLGDYSSQSGFYEDYKALKIGYFRPGDLP